MAARVLHQLRGAVEAHRLRVEQRGEEAGGLVVLEPAADGDQQRETRGVAFGKAVITKAHDLLEDGFGEGFLVAVVLHAIDELLVELSESALALPCSHGAPQLIGLVCRELGRDHRDLHHLLLEDRNAQGPLQGRSEFFLFVGDRQALGHTLTLLEVRMHHATLNGPGPHDRHLDHQVFISARLQARQHRHLRAALDLEHTDGVGVADHVEHLRVVVGDMVHLHHRAPPAVHVVEPAADGAEHAEREHVDLEHAHGFEVVLFPLDDGAVFHRRLLDRHQPRELGVREHEAADVLAQVARKTLELLRVLDPLHQLEPVFLHADARGGLVELFAEHGVVEPVVVLGELVDQPLVDADGLADVAQGAARAVADDHGGDGGALAAVLCVDVLDDFFAPLVLEVDVDVGRFLAMAAQEALEQQVAFFGVDGGDFEAIADSGIGR
ncbi:hypothetical protein FQZ97_707070 [compost metagenome]